ncbi:Tn3 family transposase [Bacillus thuringiensis]|nr:Tn3 family transposase [Bacillus thuringiensis]
MVIKNSEKLEGVDISQGKLHVERLDRGTPEEAKAFSKLLHSMLPRIKLTDLLIEVASWTGFHDQFIHASTNQSPDQEEQNIVLATLMAMGTNIGLTKMAEATLESPIDKWQMLHNGECMMMQWFALNLFS